MKFNVLGPLEVVTETGPLNIRAKRLRAMLAILLLHPSSTVPMNRIIDAMWPDLPPRSAIENIRTYIWQLRSLLGDTGADARLEKQPGGYRLHAAPEELDLLRFTTLAADGRQALHLGDYAGAAVLLEEAIALWRGDVLAELELGPAIRAKTAALEEQRWRVRLDWIQARLLLGEYAELAVTLRELIAERPLDEALWRYLVVTLYSMGRTADALSAYAEARQRLIDELGIEPGPELRKVQAAILSGDEVPPSPSRRTSAVLQEARMIPRQLPAVDPGFVGRASVIDGVQHLVAGLHVDGAQRRAVVAVSGPPGVGKSATAVAAATAVRSAFPDGQLYVDLHGSTDVPVGPAEALASVLESFGLQPGAIPQSLDRRRALYRSLLAERRMLVLVDDAITAGQVDALMPGPGQSLLLVVGPRDLAGISADLRIRLEPLDQRESLSMLGRIVGQDRIVSEPGASIDIVEACGGLPLAIRIAGDRMVARPEHAMSTFRTFFSFEDRLLDELSVDGLVVRERFDLSYQALSKGVQRCFRILGHLRPRAITVAEVAELMNVSIYAADRELELLIREGLLFPMTAQPGTPRYCMPHLLHLYARERLAREGPQLRVA